MKQQQWDDLIDLVRILYCINIALMMRSNRYNSHWLPPPLDEEDAYDIVDPN